MSPRRHRRRAKPEWEGREVITVAALPGRGLYVRHLGHPDGTDGVHRPTVPPPGARAGAPARFDERWLSGAMAELDLVHVHGLPPGLGTEGVARAIECVQEAGRPLVVTAYHLGDPLGQAGGRFDEQLELLVGGADEVITLTAGAADRVKQRFGVEATVLPHPHVVDFVRMRRVRHRRHGEFVVGAQLAGLRMPADPVHVVESLAAATRRVAGARLVVDLHDHLLDRQAVHYAPAAVAAITRAVRAVDGTVRVHRPMTDPQLWDYLFSVDVSVVPPLHGSHSVWPEACHDLGTGMVIPEDSLAAGQRPCATYRVGDAVDVDSLAGAIDAARVSGTEWRADPGDRWNERVRIAESLRRTYERLIPTKVRPLPVRAG